MRKVGARVVAAVGILAFTGTAYAYEPVVPSIVIDAKDDAGHDIADGTVAIDGETVASSLDGHAIELAIGPHTVTVTHAGQTRTEKIVAKEGEVNRQIHLAFNGGLAFSQTTDIGDTFVRDQPSRSVGPYVAMGAGVAALVTGVVVFATAPKTPSNCDAETKNCMAVPGESQAQLAQERSDASRHVTQQRAGGIVLAGGGLALAAGLVWLYLDSEKAKPRSAMIAPWLSGSSGGLAATGSF